MDRGPKPGPSPLIGSILHRSDANGDANLGATLNLCRPPPTKMEKAGSEYENEPSEVIEGEVRLPHRPPPSTGAGTCAGAPSLGGNMPCLARIGITDSLVRAKHISAMPHPCFPLWGGASAGPGPAA